LTIPHEDPPEERSEYGLTAGWKGERPKKEQIGDKRLKEMHQILSTDPVATSIWEVSPLHKGIDSRLQFTIHTHESRRIEKEEAEAEAHRKANWKPIERISGETDVQFVSRVAGEGDPDKFDEDLANGGMRRLTPEEMKAGFRGGDIITGKWVRPKSCSSFNQTDSL
jgi:hypothetical protein